MPSEAQLANLKSFLPSIISSCLASNYRPKVFVAQWILESGWGFEPSGNHNYLGLTAPRNTKLPNSKHKTHESLTEAGIKSLTQEEKASVASITPDPDHPGKFNVSLTRRFLDFSSPEECFKYKISLITRNPWYKKLQILPPTTTDDEFITLLGISGYATSPNYTKSLLAIANQKEVVEAINEELKKQSSKA